MECMYCNETETLKNLMLPICSLRYGKLYLFKDQTYRGRSIFAYNRHIDQLWDMPEEDVGGFFCELQKIQKAIAEVTGVQKVNLGCFGDKMNPPHFHVHLVPKKEGVPNFGGTFTMNQENPVYLSDEEYQELISAIREKLQ